MKKLSIEIHERINVHTVFRLRAQCRFKNLCHLQDAVVSCPANMNVMTSSVISSSVKLLPSSSWQKKDRRSWIQNPLRNKLRYLRDVEKYKPLKPHDHSELFLIWLSCSCLGCFKTNSLKALELSSCVKGFHQSWKHLFLLSKMTLNFISRV